MKYSISAYMFRVRGEQHCYNLESENPRDAWIETRTYCTKPEDIILFERQSKATLGYSGEISVYYHVPIHYGINELSLPEVLKRNRDSKVKELKLKDITGIRI